MSKFMLKKISVLFLCLLIVFSSSGQMTKTVNKFGDIRYYKYVPQDSIYGLILYLPGIGETGTDITWLERNPIPELFKSPSVLEKHYVIICPQLSSGSSWPLSAQRYLLELTERTKIEYNITKVFLTGLSLGGYTALGLMKEAYTKYGHGHFFDAVGLMCAKETSSLTLPFVEVPIKLWHGTADTENPISNMRAFKARVLAAGGDVTLVEYEGVGHNVWDLPRGYADANFWAFIAEHDELVTSDCSSEVATGTAAGVITGRTQMKAEAAEAIDLLEP
jgi:predicted peptidase